MRLHVQTHCRAAPQGHVLDILTPRRSKGNRTSEQANIKSFSVGTLQHSRCAWVLEDDSVTLPCPCVVEVDPYPGCCEHSILRRHVGSTVQTRPKKPEPKPEALKNPEPKPQTPRISRNPTPPKAQEPCFHPLPPAQRSSPEPRGWRML